MIGRTALVVDDSAAMRQRICATLAVLPGLVLREASDGAEAWRLLAGGRFDILITDINMPRLDGIKLAALVRQAGPHRAMPIVVVTTEDSGADRGRATEVGVDAYLLKAAEPAVLVETVRGLLGRR